ncbi:unnamed protein product [marine sediment metagenome]|uniref:Uncharacterized protein n=1 Tax=marine sediment metagenome TaxID=412755 RepID=X1U9Q9_9ZZZZ
MQKDFPELEGIIIDWYYPDQPDEKVKGLVVGCNYDIGVTIVNADDKTDYLTCLKGPQTVGGRKDEKWHKTSFYATVGMLRKGVYRASVQRKIRTIMDPIYRGYKKDYDDITFPSPTQEECPFN